MPYLSRSGYRGRAGIFELLLVNEEIRRLASERASTADIQRAAARNGMRTLRQDGWRKVLEGVSTVDEVLRVTKFDHV